VILAPFAYIALICAYARRIKMTDQAKRGPFEKSPDVSKLGPPPVRVNPAPMTDPAVEAARKMLNLVIAEWEWDEVRDEFRESLAQAIAAHTEAAVKEERERCAVIAEDYRDSTPFQRLADALRTEPDDD